MLLSSEAPILVLGSHRSGTSAVMGLLANAGLHIGDPIAPGPENPKGFFESDVILRAHKQLLAGVDSDWTAPPSRLDPTVLDLTPLRDAIDQVKPDEGRWGVKDPRLLYLLPAWAELVPEVAIVGVFRDPRAVAGSLVARNRFPDWVARRIALAYTERLAALHRQFHFPVVQFGSDTDVLLKRVGELAKSANLDWDEDEARQFLSEELVHHDPGSVSDIEDAHYLVEVSQSNDLRLDAISASKLKRALSVIDGGLTESLPRQFGPQHLVNRRDLWDLALDRRREVDTALEIRFAESPSLPALRRVDLDQIINCSVTELNTLPEVTSQRKPSHVIGCGVLDEIPPRELSDLFRGLDHATGSDAVVVLDGMIFDRPTLPSVHRWPELSRTSHLETSPYHHHWDQIAADLLGTSWLLSRVQPPQHGSRGVLVLVKSVDRQEEAHISPAEMRQQLNEAKQRVAELDERDRQLAELKDERDRQLAELKDERDRQLAELKDEREKQVGRGRQVENRINSLKQERNQVAAQAKRLRDELRSFERTVKARNDQIKAQNDQVEQLTKKIDQIEADKLQIAAQLRRLKGRRSVRFALRLAGVTKPMIRVWRRTRKLLARTGGGRDAAQITQSPQVRDTVHPELSGQDATGSADIVVCIHNAGEDVRACLDSIVATTNLVNHGLILVDDGSDEPVQTMLQEFASRYPVRLIRNEQAKGYTVAANQGIAASEHPNVVLLNSDTVVGPGWLEKMIRCAEVMPDTAVVGPYSNAASWQSVPVLTSADGDWQVNVLPDGLSPADVTAMVDRWSPRIYPEVPLINGFCYLITRRALDQVGMLDERSFPRGYGEEDDFSLRCAEAGLKLYVADDAYVYHAKSRSFTAETRKTIVVDSKETLRRKHGTDRFKGLVDNIRTSEDLIRSRTFVGGAIEQGDTASERDFSARRPLVGWLQPHLAEAGGIRRAIEMTNRLSRWGCRSVLITPDGWRTDWLTVLADVISVETARSMEFDVLIVSDPDMIWPFLELSAARKINYHLDSYMLYRTVDEDLRAYYAPTGDGIINVANSKWTAQQVEAHSDLGVEAIFPGGVDKRLFYPMGIEKSHDVVCHGSHRERKSTETIEHACFGLSLLKMEDRKVKQQHLARLINSGRVFVSASWLEGFNLSALEAMACGVPVVMTDDGGSREYVVDGENALVVEPKDATALREQILRLRDDPRLRAHLIENGLRTAWAYDWDGTTAEFADFLFGRGQDAARID